MTLVTGTEVTVTVDGSTARYVLGWTMAVGGEIFRHRGASEALTSKYPGESARTGSFFCEVDTTDPVQTALMTGMQTATLGLVEAPGVVHTVTAIVWPSASAERGGKPTRTFTFEETAS